MHPYKINSHGDIECDGMIFTHSQFGKYSEDTERAEEYWRKQDEVAREVKLIEIEDKYGIRFN